MFADVAGAASTKSAGDRLAWAISLALVDFMEYTKCRIGSSRSALGLGKAEAFCFLGEDFFAPAVDETLRRLPKFWFDDCVSPIGFFGVHLDAADRSSN